MGAASKAKGSSFEREVCKALSLWITHGKKTDCFWRSAMSGGRATVARKRGADVRQAGDITAVAPEGHELTDFYFIECKHYANLDITSMLIKGKGQLAKFWGVAVKEATSRNKRPWLIARQNRLPTLLLTNRLDGFGKLEPLGTIINGELTCTMWSFDHVLKTKPSKEFLPCESSSLTSTEPVTRTRTVGRVRL